MIIKKDKLNLKGIKSDNTATLNGNNTLFTNDELLINEVVETISKRKMPIIVHNGLLDLMHVLLSITRFTTNSLRAYLRHGNHLLRILGVFFPMSTTRSLSVKATL